MSTSHDIGVRNLQDLGLSEQDAIDCLKACNNNVDKAADYYFSGDLDKYRAGNTWDESAFHSDRYDNMDTLAPLTGWGPQNRNMNNSPRTSTTSATAFSHLSLPMMRYLEIQESSRTGTPLSDKGGGVVGSGGDVGFDVDDTIMDYHGGSERATAYSSSDSNVDYSIQGADVLSNDAMGPRPSSPMNTGMHDSNRQSEDFARAMRLSLADTHNTNPDYDWETQDSGIVGAHSTPTQLCFGPATKPEYDPTDWALTLSATHEIYLDPTNPNQRKRKEGEPAFFKPSSDGYHLGPALAIYHSIPLARDALLAKHKVLDDYGYNDRWWSGETIEASRITNFVENDGQELIEEIPPSEVVVEVQRLMAFLSLTKRGYGSVDSLAKMRNVSEEQQGAQIESFFKAWSTDVKFFSEVAPRPFTSQACHINSFTEGGNSGWDEFQVLTMVLEEDDKAPSMYNALDTIIWPHVLDGARDFVFKHVADIFSINIKKCNSSGNKGIGIDVPVDLYLDRYTAAFADLVKDVKSQRESISRQLIQLHERELALKSCPVGKTNVDTKQVETTKLLEAAIGHFEFLRLPSEGLSPAKQGSDGDVEMTMQTPEHVTPLDSMSLQLKGVLDRLKVRLEELAKAKEEAKKTLAELSTAFTSPETTPEGAPKLRRHTLRGVFTDLSTTFIKLPNPPNSEDPNAEVTEQWWYLSYPLRWESGANSSAYKVHKVTEKEVLEAIKYTGDGMVLLVYASDEAMKPIENDEIPVSLQNFVARDNQAFTDELSENNNNNGDTNGGSNNSKRKRLATTGSGHPPPSAQHTWWKNGGGYSNDPITIDSDDGNLYDDSGIQQPPGSPTYESSGRNRRPLKVMNPVAEVDSEDGGVGIAGIDRATSPTMSHASTAGRPQKKSPDSSWFAQEMSTIQKSGESGLRGEGNSGGGGEGVGGGGGSGFGWDDRTGPMGNIVNAEWMQMQEDPKDHASRSEITYGDDELPSYASLQEFDNPPISDATERRYDGNFVATSMMPRANITRSASVVGTKDQYGWETFQPEKKQDGEMSEGGGEKLISISSTPTSTTLSGDDMHMTEAPPLHAEYTQRTTPPLPPPPGAPLGSAMRSTGGNGSVKRKKVQIVED